MCLCVWVKSGRFILSSKKCFDWFILVACLLGKLATFEKSKNRKKIGLRGFRCPEMKTTYTHTQSKKEKSEMAEQLCV